MNTNCNNDPFKPLDGWLNLFESQQARSPLNEQLNVRVPKGNLVTYRDIGPDQSTSNYAQLAAGSADQVEINQKETLVKKSDLCPNKTFLSVDFDVGLKPTISVIKNGSVVARQNGFTSRDVNALHLYFVQKCFKSLGAK